MNAGDKPVVTQRAREAAIDDGLVARFRSALRFAASHSAISSAEEQALLAALSPEQADQADVLRERIEELEVDLWEAADHLAMVLHSDPGVKEQAARSSARDWWLAFDAKREAALKAQEG